MSGRSQEAAFLEAARTIGEGDYEAFLSQANAREAACAFSKVRENVLAWYALRPGARICELRAGEGSLTGLLLRTDPAYVLAVATEAGEAAICEARHGTRDTQAEGRDACRSDTTRGTTSMGAQGSHVALQVRSCAAQELTALVEELAHGGERFDYVVVHDLVASDAPLLAVARRLLATGGRLLVTAANALSYRELASPRISGLVVDGGVGTRQGLVHGMSPARQGIADGTRLTRQGLEDLLLGCGYARVRLWFPYPDQVFARHIFSDERQPEAAELEPHADPEGVARVAAHNEEALARAFARDRAFGEVSGGFVAEAAVERDAMLSPVSYAKVSHERSRCYALATTIEHDGGSASHNVPTVRKCALYRDGLAHVASIATHAETLARQHATHFVPNRAWLESDGSLRLEYLQGRTLEDLLVEAIVARRDQEVLDRVDSYYGRLMASATERFEISEPLLDIFGRELPREDLMSLEGLPAMPVTDIDLIFRNIVTTGREGDAWYLIDYEWTFDFLLPVAYVLWRALFYLHYADGVRAREQELDLWGRWGIDERLRTLFFNMEVSFQKHVTGDADSLDNMLRVGVPPRPTLDQLLVQGPAQQDEAAEGWGRRVLRKLRGR